MRGDGFSFNGLHQEDQGGRLYPFVLPGYAGPLMVSKRQYEAAGKRCPRLLLSAIRRDARALLGAPTGSTLVELDFRSCHAAIGLALSGDDRLATNLDGDIHQIIGDEVARNAPKERRRDLGKALNLRMLFGATPMAVAELSAAMLGRPPRDETGETVWRAWWARYPRLGVFRDSVVALVREAQVGGLAIVIESPSGAESRFSRAEVMGRVGKGRAPPGAGNIWRTIFSAAFRAVEADLLNETVRRFVVENAGGKLVLPMYDGLIAAAPKDGLAVVERALLKAAAGAVEAVGIPKLTAQIKRR
jgi:hypothetical protein